MSIKPPSLMLVIAATTTAVAIGTAPAGTAAPCDRLHLPGFVKHECELTRRDDAAVPSQTLHAAANRSHK
jgi:hypothetical protein